MPPFIKQPRFCRRFQGSDYFKPQGVSLRNLEVNELKLDELEAIHLCDYEDLDQKTAAEKMKISTSTLQRLLYVGRKKVADVIYSSKALRILKDDDITEYMPLRNRKRYGRYN